MSVRLRRPHHYGYAEVWIADEFDVVEVGERAAAHLAADDSHGHLWHLRMIANRAHRWGAAHGV